MLLLVARRDAGNAGLDPNLEKVRHVLSVIELAVQHALPRAHALHVPRHDDRAVSYAVFVGELALQHVADDLHVAVAVRSETRPRLNSVLVDHSEMAESH